ncbi:hypothetical protein SAMN05660653_00168 [Desulfonatronum thiosulfatophilum]|uniref:Helix-turn-helix domain-containing protein n=1 Tax=Desulfonatronum thiosulfatophilum TaxID=617002 RepID=A0A1G6A5V3_9BACT|nr:hypothetical protein [Desulfonatronum thiosulfatophilum]SDB03690.1 hypothetical protein SAMN05660653_00168 [Desulfonatronum thiosulfatophilum]
MRRLFGMKEISKYMGRSEETLQVYRRRLGLPIVKIVGTWEADVEDLEKWRLRQAEKHVKPVPDRE